MKTILKINHCQRCGEPDVAFVMSNGDTLCPQCTKVSLRFSKASANHFKNKIKPVYVIDTDCHLGMICAQVMAFYITNGMSVRQVARQLGITHATVYAKLRKNGLMKPATESDAILQPTLHDFMPGAGKGREFVVIQKPEIHFKPKKCVTPISRRSLGFRKPASTRAGPESNA